MATLPPKLYFRIGEVAGLVGVEPHVLRYWEREFRSIRPTKSATGQRVYSRRDVENLMRVRELLYSDGFTIAGAKKKLARAGTTATDADDDSGAVDRRPGMSEPDRVYAGRHATETARAPQTSLASSPEPLESDERSANADVRAALVELRSEIEAFLAELGG